MAGESAPSASASASAAEQLPGQKRVLWALLSQVLLIMLGMGLVGPVMPLYAKSFGVSAAMVGSLATAFAVARIIMNLPVGSMTERLGRRPLLVCGPFLICVASFFTGLANRFELLILLRFVQGLGSSMQTTTAMTVMADITNGQKRGRAMSYYQGALLLGNSLGPTVGGLVAQYLGFRAPFFAYAALALLAGLWAFLAVPETRGFSQAKPRAEGAAAAPVAPQSTRAMLAGLLGDFNFILVSLVTLVIFFSRSGGQGTVLPLFGNAQLGLNPGQLGFAFTLISLCNLVTINASGALCDKYGRKAVIVPSTLFCGLAFFSFTLSKSYGYFLFSAALLGVGSGLSGPAPAAYVADLCRPGCYGMTMGLYRTFGDIGMSIGPLLLGWISDRVGFGPALWLNAIVFVVVGVVFGLFAMETGKCEPKIEVDAV